ncbi:hypothetical protein OFC17_35810, partial [Escherichia coli]|nr:hypothetical protein [Escherichia coli]
ALAFAKSNVIDCLQGVMLTAQTGNCQSPMEMCLFYVIIAVPKLKSYINLDFTAQNILFLQHHPSNFARK